MAVELSNGLKMPLIGFGTFRIKSRETIFTCIDSALKSGYRSIDTAVIYRNEEHIGAALSTFLPKHKLTREEIFITSKLSPRDQGFDSCLTSVKKSLENLRTNYLDLYLIHWPGAGGLKVDDPGNLRLRQESWAALEKCYSEGLLRAIGVSNYTVKHLEEMKNYAKIFPHVLQVEHHPHYMQDDLLDYCNKHSIHYQAYSSLGTTVEAEQNPLLNDPTVLGLAKKYEKTPAQILLRWATKQNIGVLPKSTNPIHINENIQLDFDISENDLNALSNLGVRRKYAWDPEVVV